MVARSGHNPMWCDVLASSITNDHGMGRGFFFSNSPLRDLDPPDREKKWPDDASGEPHDDGEIIGGTMWDLRKELESRLGTTVSDFAYPDGQFDEKVVAAVAEAGYARAYSACRHQHPGHSMQTIPRQLLWERACVDPRGRFSHAVMSCQLEWVFAASGCGRDHGSTTGNGR